MANLETAARHLLAAVKALHKYNPCHEAKPHLAAAAEALEPDPAVVMAEVTGEQEPAADAPDAA